VVLVRRQAALYLGLSLFSILSCAQAADAGGLTKDGQLAPEWVRSIGAKSLGSITPSNFPGDGSANPALPDSVLIQAEPRMHALILRRNDLQGTDLNPLCATVQLRTQPGTDGPTQPALYLYWDNYNYLSMRCTGEGHVFCTVVVRGAVARELPFWGAIADVPSNERVKWKESWLRIRLVSRNALFFMSRDGLNWRKLGESGCRPGQPGKEPVRIILGRGWVGEGKASQAELCNDYYPDGNKTLVKTLFSKFSLTDSVALVGDIPGFAKKETWENTLAALEADGIPRSWSFLGPVSLKDSGWRKQLGPDLTDDWSVPLKDAVGNVIKSVSWTAQTPEDGRATGDAGAGANEEEQADGYVDLSEHLGHSYQCVAWAKTEIQWPVRGQVLIWFGASDAISLYVNNQLVHADEEGQEHRAFKDRYCVHVALNKGRNTIKVRYRQIKGEWGFYLRLERNDPAYRARLLEKMLEAFPDPTEGSPVKTASAGWRAARARHEIVRCYESLGDYRGALAACDKALVAFAQDDENRMHAFETKLHVLEFLRDTEALVKAGEDYLAAYPGMAGAASAMRAALRGDAFAGRAEAAQNRAKRYCSAFSNSAAIVRVYRDLATAFKEAGDNGQHLFTLDSLADQAGVEPLVRAQAAIESAMCRWTLESDRIPKPTAPAPPPPLDADKLALACNSAAKALAILPGGKSPMAAVLAQEAAADLKAGKAEQAMAGYWGALLLALCASHHDAAQYLSFSSAYRIVMPQKDKDGKPFEDPTLFKKAQWKALAAGLGDPTWLGKWRYVGFPLEPTANIRTPLAPERELDRADYGQAARWQGLDLDQDPFPDVYRGNHDLGVDLRRWSGNNQVAYLSREFEVPAPHPTLSPGGRGQGEGVSDGPLWMRISACSSWIAWVDGQPAGANTNVAGYRFEGEHLKLNLSPGRHRLLLKLEAPLEGPFAFRVRLSREPELAAHLLVLALTARQFPRAVADRRPDFLWLLNFMQGAGFLAKGNGNETPYVLANVISQLYAHDPAARLEPLTWACERMKDAADSAQLVAALQDMIALLETVPWYAERDRQVSELCIRLAFALVGEGRLAAADTVLRDLSNRYHEHGESYFHALTLRGNLRRDIGQNLGALPFFASVIRECPHTWAWKTLRPAAVGLEWAKTYRPERLSFDTSYEAQAVLAAIRRQLNAGGAEEIERAMRNIGDLLASSPGALSKIVDSPYYARFVGIREYIRALLGSLPEAARDVYRKTVETPSARRFRTAAYLNDVAALEALANEYFYTPAADAARNHAGNLYLDQGHYAQAASMFQTMLKQTVAHAVEPADNAQAVQPADNGQANSLPHKAMLYAKLAKALLADGSPAAAEAAIGRLRAEYAAESLTVAGESMTGLRLAERLKNELAHSKLEGPGERPTDPASAAATQLGNLCRTGAFQGPAPVPGPVVWAHPLIPQAAMESARGPFELAARSHVPSFPVAAEGRVFVTGLESARAIDLASGKIIWTRTWGSGGPLLKGFYNGYPVNSPTVHGGRLFTRALESGASSIRCYAAENGKLRWSSQACPELRKLVWIGDPAVAYNLVFAVYLEPGDMNTHGVAAMDEETGRLCWKTNLVTGGTGIKVADQYWLSALHLGPPAVDGGELYIASGLASVAALNAFSGEVKWITTYPRLQFPDPQYGYSRVGYDLRANSCKTFARGPLSPMLVGDLLLVAPKDGCGLLAFERQGGALSWQVELADCRYIAGIANGNVLLCDDGVSAVSLANGRAVWEYRLQDDYLYGQPTLSGGQIYLPAGKQLQRLDARTGRLLGASAWDPRLGPLANMVVVGQAVSLPALQQARQPAPPGAEGKEKGPCLVGVGENVIAALGQPDAKAVALPLYEARELEAAGKLEAAAEAYEKLLSSKDIGEVLHALTARKRILDKLGKHDLAQAALEQFEQGRSSEMLSSFNGLWQVRKDVFAQSLRAAAVPAAPAGRPDAPPPPRQVGRSGESPQDEGTAVRDLGSSLTFSWFLPGDNCMLFDPNHSPQTPSRGGEGAGGGPREKPCDSCFAYAGGDIFCVSMRPVDSGMGILPMSTGGTPVAPGTGSAVLWRNYVGPGVLGVLFSSRLVAAVTFNRISVFDRATGEALCEVFPVAPDASARFRQMFHNWRFEGVTLSDNALVAATQLGLYAWSLPGGKLSWWKRTIEPRAVAGGLAISGERVLRVQGCREQNKNENVLNVYDLSTGNEVRSLPLGRRAPGMIARFTPDLQHLLYRVERSVMYADLAQMKTVWQVDLPKLDARRGLFEFEEDHIRYYGLENEKFPLLLWLNPADGKELRPRVHGFGFRMNGEYAVFGNDGPWYKAITRERVQGDKIEKVWETNLLPQTLYYDHYLVAAIPGQGRFHLLYVRYRSNQDQFLCRTFSWETGQLLSEQVLPGTPVRLEDNSPNVSVVQQGSALIYTAREGVFSYCGADQPAAKMVEQLRTELAKPGLPDEQRRSLHRAWVDLEPPSLMAFLAPADMQIDGDLSEWESTEPVRLQGLQHFVPLAGDDWSGTAGVSPAVAAGTAALPASSGDTSRPGSGPGSRWKGEDDLSAKIYVGWNREGLALAVDVTDDVLAGPQPGMELTSGDCLRVVVDSRPEAGSGLDRGEGFVGALAWVNGRTVLDRELGTAEESGAEPQGRVLRSPNGKGCRYEMLIPWPLIRKDPAQRPGTQREMRLGVAVYDNDGAGVKGALELGAGATFPSCVPQWLCRLTLLDVSQEKVERYRQVLDLLPDCQEADRFLHLILLSKRGDKADEERAAELEGFITAHPGCRTALHALGQLRAVYRRLGGAAQAADSGTARLKDFVQRTKAPQHLQQAAESAAFKFWVLPDPKTPPQVILAQFAPTGDWNYALRAYWGSVSGTPCAAWGRDGTKALLCLGPLPKPGEWTELSISPFDLGLEGREIKELAFTTYGGIACFDRAAVVVAGKEKVLIDDAWPPNPQFRGDSMKFVDQPRHDGAKGWTFDKTDKGLRNCNIYLGGGAPIVSFAEMLPPAPTQKPDPVAQQELYRKVAGIIPDTPEGLAFLRRVLDFFPDPGRAGKCKEELRSFLKAYPNTTNGAAIMKLLHGFFADAGEPDPRAACEAVLQEYKLPRDVKRAYYNEFAPAWSEWHVLGPFAAQGDLRGMDVIIGPERGVDINWKTVNSSGLEIGWKKISNRIGPDKKPNSDPVVDLRRHLLVPKVLENKGPYFGFAYTKFNVPSKRRALLLFGAQDIVSIWLNGKRVANELETQPQKDKETAEVQLRSGENEILIKVGVSRDQRLGFVFRIADKDGKPFADISNE